MKPTTDGHSNEAYLLGIREGDEDMLKHIYKDYLPKVSAFIQSRGGTEQEAEDIFATALEVIYLQIRQDALKLEKSFPAYLFTVCKYQWLKFFRKKVHLSRVTKSIEAVQIKEEDMPDCQLEEKLLAGYIRAAFRQLSKDCREIIQMRWEGESYADIRDLMGYKSEGYTRKRKHICYKRLQELIRQDPRIRELYED